MTHLRPSQSPLLGPPVVFRAGEFYLVRTWPPRTGVAMMASQEVREVLGARFLPDSTFKVAVNVIWPAARRAFRAVVTATF